MHQERSNEVRVFMESKERAIGAMKQQLADEKVALIEKFESALRKKALDSEQLLSSFKEAKDLND